MIATAEEAVDDYTIDYIHSQMTIQLTTYTMYTLSYTMYTLTYTMYTLTYTLTYTLYKVYVREYIVCDSVR